MEKGKPNETNFTQVRDSIMNEMENGEEKLIQLIGADTNICHIIQKAGIRDPEFVYTGASVKKFMDTDVRLYNRSMLELTMVADDADYKLYAIITYRGGDPFCRCLLMQESDSKRYIFDEEEDTWHPYRSLYSINDDMLDDPGSNELMQSVADQIVWPKEILKEDTVKREVEENGLLLKIYDQVGDMVRFIHQISPYDQDNQVFLLPADKGRVGGAVVQEGSEAVLYMRILADDVLTLDAKLGLPEEFHWMMDAAEQALSAGQSPYVIWHKIYSTPFAKDMAEVLTFMWDHCHRKNPVLCLPLSRHAYLEYIMPDTVGTIIRSEGTSSPTESELQNIAFFEQGGGIDGTDERTA